MKKQTKQKIAERLDKLAALIQEKKKKKLLAKKEIEEFERLKALVTPKKGIDYQDGEKGDTPKAGVDFPIPKDGKDYVLTEDDKKEIASRIEVPVVEKIIEKTEVIREKPVVKETIVKEKTVKEIDKEALNEIAVKILDLEKEVKAVVDISKTGWKLETKDIVKLLSDKNIPYEKRLSVLVLKDLNRLNFYSPGGAGSKVPADLASVTQVKTLTVNINGRYSNDGTQSAIIVGTTGYIYVPFAGTITAWYITETSQTPIAGSIVIDVWKDASANYPPTSGDTIAGTEKPTLTTQNRNSDTSLSTWTTSVTAGDYIGFTVDSNDGCKNIQLLLTITLD